MKKHEVPTGLEMTLTIKETSGHSKTGVDQIESTRKQPNGSFAFCVGTKNLTKRRKPEQYLSGSPVI